MNPITTATVNHMHRAAAKQWAVIIGAAALVLLLILGAQRIQDDREDRDVDRIGNGFVDELCSTDPSC